MAHPIIEALYIGLLTSGLSQPVDTPTPVMTPPSEVTPISIPVRRRVVYDWVSRERHVFETDVARRLTGQPMVGITDEQVDRMMGATRG